MVPFRLSDFKGAGLGGFLHRRWLATVREPVDKSPGWGDPMTRRMISFLGATMLLMAVGCGSDDDAELVELGLVEQLEAVGLGAYLSRPLPDPTSDPQNDGDFLRYDFAVSDDGPACLFGTPYRVYIRPGDSEKVLFYLEGGGGCWNEETCFGGGPLGAKETPEPFIPLSFPSGVLSDTDPNNPFAGWTVLYVPYCDGSVFSGDNVVTYDSGTIYHRGQVNLSAAIDVMRANNPAPSEIVVSGSSAGGFGTFPGYGVMRVAYPGTKIYVLNDSGPGLQNNDDQVAIAERRENWRFEDFIVEGCTECKDQPAYLTDWALDNDPDLRAALFSYQRDFVISNFLMLDRTDYRDLMFDVTGEINARQPDKFKRFMVLGASHTILLGAGIGPDGGVGSEGTLASLEIEGIGLLEWIADFLTDGPNWQDLIEEEAPVALQFPGLDLDRTPIDVSRPEFVPYPSPWERRRRGITVFRQFPRFDELR